MNHAEHYEYAEEMPDGVRGVRVKFDKDISLTQIGSLVKIITVVAVLFGTFVGGATIYKIGINRSLWVFGVVQMVSILGFAVLSEVGDNLGVLAAVITFEYLGVGMGASAQAPMAMNAVLCHSASLKNSSRPNSHRASGTRR